MERYLQQEQATRKDDAMSIVQELK
jgi:hypothetical protein